MLRTAARYIASRTSNAPPHASRILSALPLGASPTSSRPRHLALPRPQAALSTRRMSSTAPSAPLGNPLDAVKYEAGRAEALKWADKEGFAREAVVELPVQWGDMDSNAHVNNVVYFRWLETGRLAYMRHLTHALPPDVAHDLHGSGKGKGVILAKIGFDYVKPSFYPDSVLVMHKPLQYSSRKMVLETGIYSYAQQTVVGRGSAIMVSYDYDAGKSAEWPQALVDELEKAGAKREEKGTQEGRKAKL